jgi:hypothetical protein
MSGQPVRRMAGWQDAGCLRLRIAAILKIGAILKIRLFGFEGVFGCLVCKDRPTSTGSLKRMKK